MKCQADPGPWLPPAASFCQFDQSNVILLAFKAAEDGDGLIVRLAEIEGRATTVTMTLPFVAIAQALQTNMVEEDESVLTYDRHNVRVPIAAHGIATVRCRTVQRWPVATRVAWH